MKILFHITASTIHQFLASQAFNNCIRYKDYIVKILEYGSTSMFGANLDKLNTTHFVCFANSEKLQKLWAKENNFQYNENNWEIDILNAQIEEFKPDVFYSFNPTWTSQNIEKIRKTPIKAIWKASPIPEEDNYTCFDIGVAFNQIYLDNLSKHGAKHTIQQDFCFDYKIRKRFPEEIKKSIDISFAGTYNDWMFPERTEYLLAINERFGWTKKTRFYFKVGGKRFFNLLPRIPIRLMNAHRKPVFLKEFLEVIAKSKITFNCHSQITGERKGNMRVFETLGMGAFMLSDKGEYPPNIEDGKDFISYTNTKDLLDKIAYFLKHEQERKEIAAHGYETLKKYYSNQIANNSLEDKFKKYL